MAIIITSPVTGSLRIQSTAASPQVSYLTNIATCIVSGDYSSNSVLITDTDNRLLEQFPVSSITRISASTQGFDLTFAVDAIASLIMK